MRVAVGGFMHESNTFAPLRTVSARTLVAIAAQVGPVRLIDNIVLEPVPVATG